MDHDNVTYLYLIDKSPDAVFILHEKRERNFSMHKHKKGQLTYVEGGIAYVSLEDSTYVIPARHYIWIPGNIYHELKVRQEPTAIRSLFFYNDDDVSDTFFQKMGIYPITTLLHEMIVYTSRFPDCVDRDRKEFNFLVALKELLPQVSKFPLPFVLPTTYNERFRPIIDHITEHLSGLLTLDSVSEVFHISKRSLSRLFQTELSISFLQYVRQRRIIKALELMLHTDMNLTEIAYETGYQSLNAFSDTFYQVMRMRPSEFIVLH